MYIYIFTILSGIYENKINVHSDMLYNTEHKGHDSLSLWSITMTNSWEHFILWGTDYVVLCKLMSSE